MVFIPSTCSRTTSRITSRVSSRIWRGAIWRVSHLRADSEVRLSQTSSVWPWSGVPKVCLYDTFLGGLCQEDFKRNIPHKQTRHLKVLFTVNAPQSSFTSSMPMAHLHRENSSNLDELQINNQAEASNLTLSLAHCITWKLPSAWSIYYNYNWDPTKAVGVWPMQEINPGLIWWWGCNTRYQLFTTSLLHYNAQVSTQAKGFPRQGCLPINHPLILKVGIVCQEWS